MTRLPLAVLTGACLAATALVAPAPAPAAASPAAAAAALVDPTAQPGFDGIGVRRATTWLLRGSIDARTTPVPFADGPVGGVPLAGDFDGDGDDSLAVFSDGTWSLSDGPGGQRATVRFGARGDRPVIGDWDGDGREDLGVLRGGRWYLRAALGTRTFGYGAPGDVPVVGDWDGDGVSGIGLRRGTTLLLRQQPTPGVPDVRFTYGVPSDLPVVGDWDHNGLDEVGVFRSGTWFLRGSDGRTQTVAYGGRGDLPVVQTRAVLTPGLEHRVLSTGDTRVQVASLDLSRVATPRPVLAGDRIGGLERTTTMTKRSGALLGVNGDFAAPDGRPVHAFGAAATLQQYGLDLGGSALGFSESGLAAADRPTVGVTLTPEGGVTRTVERYNRSAPVGEELAAWTAVSRGVEVVPDDACYAALGFLDGPRAAEGGVLRRTLEVLAVRCGGPSPGIPATSMMLAAQQVGSGGDFLRSLQVGARLTMDHLLGFPGSTSLLGASELLLSAGQVVSSQVDRPGEFAQGRLPRTAAGLTADGRLLLVVVDGRQPGWSVGLSLRQLATLLQGLGAVSAVNLDGGGSSTMVVSGLITNRPSDGRERGVSSALAISSRTAPAPAGPARATAALRGTGPSPDLARITRDPGSTGGLLASHATSGGW